MGKTGGAGSANSLIFRKYYLVSTDTNGLQEGLSNTIFLTCQRRYLDHLVIHIPDNVVTSTIKRDEWMSKTELRILADDVGFTLMAEYIKGDFFIDFTEATAKPLSELLNARSVMVEFGPADERIALYTDNKGPGGTGDLRGFVQEYTRVMLRSVGANNLRVYDTAGVFRACSNFKKSRH